MSAINQLVEVEKRMLPMDYVVKRIGERLGNIPIGQPEFADSRYTPHDFDINYFHPIVDAELNSALSFIDGGNIPIINSHNFSVQLVRIYFNIFRGKKRIEPRKIPPRLEFYVACCATERSGRIFYEAELVPIKEEWSRFSPNKADLCFDSFDKTLRTAKRRVPIDRIAEAARVFMEWQYAASVIEEELEAGDIIVHDGSLQTSITNERKYHSKAAEKAMEKDVKLLSLSKTSTLFTSTGYSLFAAISELSESSSLAKSSWFYHPIVDINQPDHRAEMYAVKLHPSSEYVFRLEFLKPQAEKMSLDAKGNIISLMAQNSADASFPGYPYGLLDADRFARVSFNEKECQKIQFLLCANKARILNRLMKCVKSVDAHDALNQTIRG
jgi:hypothetical protein